MMKNGKQKEADNVSMGESERWRVNGYNGFSFCTGLRRSGWNSLDQLLQLCLFVGVFWIVLAYLSTVNKTSRLELIMWKMASIKVHKQPPRIAPSFHRVKAYCTPRDVSVSNRPSHFFPNKSYNFIMRSDFRGCRAFLPFLQLCESAGGSADHHCQRIILLQSSEPCNTQRSLGGIFVYSPFYFSNHILLYIINRSRFESPFYFS